MSYEIIYDKQFIDLKDGRFIPVLYMGSNNCYEYVNGRERRERSWNDFSWINNGRSSGTLASMVERAEKEKEDKKKENDARKRDDWWEPFNEKNWGYWHSLQIGSGNTRETTFGMYVGLFKTGCKKALTVEELGNYGVRVKVYTYPIVETDNKLKSIGLERISVAPKTTAELIGVINKYEQILLDAKIYLHINIDATEWQMKRIRKEKFPINKREKEEVQSKSGYAIMTDAGYFVKKTRNGYRYSPYKNGGAQFLTQKDANKKSKLLKDKYLINAEVVPVEYTYARRFYITKQ